MSMIQRSFQIEEETKVSENTSLPGRFASDSGIAAWWDILLQTPTRLTLLLQKGPQMNNCLRETVISDWN